MTKSMEKSSTLEGFDINELLKADKLLSKIKSNLDKIYYDQIALPTDPKSNHFHFIKSEYFWNIFKEKIQKNKCSNLIVLADQKLKELILAEPLVTTCLVTPNFELSMALASKVLHDKKFSHINHHLDGRISGTAVIHPSALVSPLAFIGEYVEIQANVEIMPGTYVGAHSTIGESTKLFPKVSIYTHVKIGKNCRIHSGTVIGSDGFGYVFHQGQHVKIWHIGSVIIKDDVEIGANSCIDAGTFIPTLISEKCIIDNLVQVGHNTQVRCGSCTMWSSWYCRKFKIGNYTVSWVEKLLLVLIVSLVIILKLLVVEW
jgi:UDP-3-O-[3-hydroxymyristoyl] glucosamine N-acyltransferase